VRVIAGSARGLTLAAPRDRTTRPISDRVKETLFAILGDRVPGAQVLDLYAGSGAIGIEALSRGAEHCTFVEHARQALDVLRDNLARTRFEDRADVRGGDVERYLASQGPAGTNLAFLDPPYAERAILPPLQRLAADLRPGATVVIKTFWRTEIPPVAGLQTWRQRRFGETMLTFLECVEMGEGEDR
jgi:16S rRNA (guanine966-N2)-methyltransferase